MWEWGKQQLEEEVATSRNSEIGSYIWLPKVFFGWGFSW